MTGADWLTCDDSGPMLEHLRGETSTRKLRLFAVACCRHIWHLLEEQRSRDAVEVVERIADGLCGEDELRSASEQAGEAAEAAHWENRAGTIQTAAEAAAMASTEVMSLDLAIRLAETVAEAAGDEATDEAWEATWTTPGKTNEERWAVHEAIYRQAEAKESSRLADLLRDIFGNPFRPVELDPGWLAPNVVMLAQRIYEDRAFDRMPELADALGAAGCKVAEILSHRRQLGEHVRGCWVVDLILGRE
jgi:hypothetical protein